MPNNYLSLSPTDFETLAADILSAMHGVHFERYGEGRDGGVDGKFLTNDGGIWIVQAKRYRDVKALLRQMEHEQKKNAATAPGPSSILFGYCLLIKPSKQSSHSASHEAVYFIYGRYLWRRRFRCVTSPVPGYLPKTSSVMVAWC